MGSRAATAQMTAIARRQKAEIECLSQRVSVWFPFRFNLLFTSFCPFEGGQDAARMPTRIFQLAERRLRQGRGWCFSSSGRTTRRWTAVCACAATWLGMTILQGVLLGVGWGLRPLKREVPKSPSSYPFGQGTSLRGWGFYLELGMVGFAFMVAGKRVDWRENSKRDELSLKECVYQYQIMGRARMSN